MFYLLVYVIYKWRLNWYKLMLYKCDYIIFWLNTYFPQKTCMRMCSFFFFQLFIYLLAVSGFHCMWAFSSCGEQVLLFVVVRGLLTAQSQQLWHTGLVAPQHVGSSGTRAQTCVPCIGRQVLNHCTTREVPNTKYIYVQGHYELETKIYSQYSVQPIEVQPIQWQVCQITFINK